jgi:hypothetical protein
MLLFYFTEETNRDYEPELKLMLDLFRFRNVSGRHIPPTTTSGHLYTYMMCFTWEC